VFCSYNLFLRLLRAAAVPRGPRRLFVAPFAGIGPVHVDLQRLTGHRAVREFAVVEAVDADEIFTSGNYSKIVGAQEILDR
jgi:hypothetical protein